MKLQMDRRGINIVPESDQDVAFLEDTLGFRLGKNGVVKTVPVTGGLTAWSYLRIERQGEKP